MADWRRIPHVDRLLKEMETMTLTEIAERLDAAEHQVEVLTSEVISLQDQVDDLLERDHLGEDA